MICPGSILRSEKYFWSPEYPIITDDESKGQVFPLMLHVIYFRGYTVYMQ